MGDERSSLDVVRESKLLAYSVGAMCLVAGIVLLFWPDRTLTVVARLSGILLIVVGLGDLLDTVRHHRGEPYWIILALRGLINLGFGLALLFWPGITLNVLVWLIGLDFVLAGILGLLVRGQMPKEYRSGTLGRSLVTIAFGVALMVWPDSTLNVVALLVGGLLTVLGLVLVWSGWRVGKLEGQLQA